MSRISLTAEPGWCVFHAHLSMACSSDERVFITGATHGFIVLSSSLTAFAAGSFYSVHGAEDIGARAEILLDTSFQQVDGKSEGSSSHSRSLISCICG